MDKESCAASSDNSIVTTHSPWLVSLSYHNSFLHLNVWHICLVNYMTAIILIAGVSLVLFYFEVKWRLTVPVDEQTEDEVFARTNSTGNSRRVRFRQIAEELRAAIERGIYRPGDHLPTEMELAHEQQVSRATAAAALTELARAGLVTRTPRRGTIVRRSVQPPRSPTRPLVALLVVDIEETFILSLQRGVQRGVRDAGFGLLLADSGSNHEDEGKAICDAVASGASGIMIFIQDGESYNAEILRLVARDYPVVLIDRYLRGVRCAVVSSDNVAGSRMVVQELLDAGHRHICVVTFSPRTASTTEDRLRGYVEALTDAGVPVDYSLHYVVDNSRVTESGWEPRQEVVAGFASFLLAHAEVTAIYATNAYMGIIALRAVQYLRLQIPADLSLVCIDPLEAAPLSVPAITCALQQSAAMGRTAVALLQDVMAGKPPRAVALSMELRRVAR